MYVDLVIELQYDNVMYNNKFKKILSKNKWHK